jgi:DNA processing protein
MFPASNRPAHLREGPELPAMTLTDTEQAIYDLVDKEESTTDDIIRRSGLPSSSVSVGLLGLEMKRLIRQLPGKLFVRNK